MRPANSLPLWVCEAQTLPVAFAQVREDPWIDARIVQRLEPAARVLLIASGGCTLAFLAATNPDMRFDVVDSNPAQIALARLKIELLLRFDTSMRLALLGHCPMPAQEREARLCAVLKAVGMPENAIGLSQIWSTEGPDFSGRYERVFSALRRELSLHETEVRHLLSLRDPTEQAQRVAPGTALGRALEEAFERTMDLSILIGLFGEGATRNRVEPFARHFARRTRHALATLPAAENPFLWQVLAGRYPAVTTAPWLGQEPPARLPEITWSTTAMAEALSRSPSRYDFIHLSNILDWLDESEARATLHHAHAALRPGGWVLIRQLNSTLDIVSLGEAFRWEPEEATALHSRDRSYFYRSLHLGRKR